jgi:hypothetical protein
MFGLQHPLQDHERSSWVLIRASVFDPERSSRGPIMALLPGRK